MKRFNTSRPNIPEEHYTIVREDLLKKGIELVDSKRYFTIVEKVETIENIEISTFLIEFVETKW